MDSQRTSRRGFAGMDQRKQREIARKGGQAAHQKGTAHEFTSDEARAAGRKGGEIVSANRAHMSAIGRKGGESSHGGPKASRIAEAPDSPVGNEIADEGAGNPGEVETAGNGRAINGDDGNGKSHDTNGHSHDRSVENGSSEAERVDRIEADSNRE